MSWTPTKSEEIAIGLQVVEWIATARAAGYTSMGREWYPSRADFVKSALYERIRSGLRPLPEPPPVGLACPWYALVEDPGPHYVVWETIPVDEPEQIAVFREQGFTGEIVTVLQQPYEVIEKTSDTDMIIRDAHHGRGTSYRFRLWWDAQWRHPSHRPGQKEGGWFIQNVVFASGAGASA